MCFFLLNYIKSSENYLLKSWFLSEFNKSILLSSWTDVLNKIIVTDYNAGDTLEQPYIKIRLCGGH